MLQRPKPVSNFERQRQFRERNPGYFNKYNARRRAAAEATRAKIQEEARAMALQGEPLMLPAPVVTVEIPRMNTIDAAVASEAVCHPETRPAI